MPTDDKDYGITLHSICSKDFINFCVMTLNYCIKQVGRNHSPQNVFGNILKKKQIKQIKHIYGHIYIYTGRLYFIYMMQGADWQCETVFHQYPR